MKTSSPKQTLHNPMKSGKTNETLYKNPVKLGTTHKNDQSPMKTSSSLS